MYVCQKLQKSVNIRQSYERRQSGSFLLRQYIIINFCYEDDVQTTKNSCAYLSN